MGAMSPIDTRVETEVAPRTPPAHGGRTAAPPPTVDRRPERTTSVVPAPDASARRRAIAAAIVDIVDGAIVDRDALEIVLAGPGDARTRGARSRVVVKGPDAVAHLLLPPSGDAFAEAYLRGEVEIEGDVMATVVAAESIDVRRLHPARPPPDRPLAARAPTGRRAGHRPPADLADARRAPLAGAGHGRDPLPLRRR